MPTQTPELDCNQYSLRILIIWPPDIKLYSQFYQCVSVTRCSFTMLTLLRYKAASRSGCYSLQGLSAQQDPKATFQAKSSLLSAQYRHDSSRARLKWQYTYPIEPMWVRHLCRWILACASSGCEQCVKCKRHFEVWQVLCLQRHLFAPHFPEVTQLLFEHFLWMSLIGNSVTP